VRGSVGRRLLQSTTEQFCDPAGAAGGGGSGGASGGGGGGFSTGETIVIHNPVQGGTYCGSFADAFVDRDQDCPNRGVKVNCSPVDGCLKCPEEGCIAGHPAPNRGKRPKGAARKKKPSATISRHEACRQLAIDERDAVRRYGDVHRFQLSLGFTWDEIDDGMELQRIKFGPATDTVIFTSKTKTITVSSSGLPNGYWARWGDYISHNAFLSQLMERNSCSDFGDLVEAEESDVYHSIRHPLP
jgi:hypothetical protein